jgi:hypothetical protein
MGKCRLCAFFHVLSFMFLTTSLVPNIRLYDEAIPFLLFRPSLPTLLAMLRPTGLPLALRRSLLPENVSTI